MSSQKTALYHYIKQSHIICSVWGSPSFICLSLRIIHIFGFLDLVPVCVCVCQGQGVGGLSHANKKFSDASWRSYHLTRFRLPTQRLGQIAEGDSSVLQDCLPCLPITMPVTSPGSYRYF